jgi:hypothetical protein
MSDYGHCPRCGSLLRGYTTTAGFTPEPHVCMTLTTHPDRRDVEIARLREALEWYANPENTEWQKDGFGGLTSNVMDDGGGVARVALNPEVDHDMEP